MRTPSDRIAGVDREIGRDVRADRRTADTRAKRTLFRRLHDVVDQRVFTQRCERLQIGSPVSIVRSGGMFARIAGLLTPAPSAPCSDACTMLSTSESSRSDANAFSVLPFDVSVQTSSFLPQSAGTRTLNTKRLRRG